MIAALGKTIAGRVGVREIQRAIEVRIRAAAGVKAVRRGDVLRDGRGPAVFDARFLKERTARAVGMPGEA